MFLNVSRIMKHIKKRTGAVAVAMWPCKGRKAAPIRNEKGVKFPGFLVCIHSVEITEI